FLLAQGENRSAGCIRYREGIAQVFVAILQSMKGQKMERAVRHEDKMVSLKKRAQRRNQFTVKRFQMALGRPQERLFESLHIIIAHAKFGNLKTQQLQEMSDA